MKFVMSAIVALFATVAMAEHKADHAAPAAAPAVKEEKAATTTTTTTEHKTAKTKVDCKDAANKENEACKHAKK